VRRLDDIEVAAYDLVPPEIARRARVQRVPLLPRGAGGMTIGRFIFLLDDRVRDGSSKLLAHELVHVEQYRQQGYLAFSVRYLWHYGKGMLRYRLRHRTAYRHIPVEVAAYAAADRWWKARTSDSRL
jgi:hypothetical protein